MFLLRHYNDNSDLLFGNAPHLHPHLYKEEIPGAIYHGQYHTMEEEIEKTSGNMLKGISADITVIPLASTKLSNVEIQEIINRMGNNMLNVYNLCTSILSENYQENSQLSKEIKDELDRLIQTAQEISKLIGYKSDKDLKLIAAQACSHAIVAAIFNDPHALEKEYGRDTATQHTSIYILKKIFGNDHMHKFIIETQLLDLNAILASPNLASDHRPKGP